MKIPPPVAIFAVKQLAKADYTIANRISDDVAFIVQWSYEHSNYWIPPLAMQSLQYLDNLGSALIAIVVWIVAHV